MSNRPRARPPLDHSDPVRGRTGIGHRHGEDFDGDVTVTRRGDGTAFILPTAVRRLDEDGVEIVAALQEHTAAISEMQAHFDDLVAEARAAGLSWSVIGWSIGTTGEAARQRWGSR